MRSPFARSATAAVSIALFAGVCGSLSEPASHDECVAAWNEDAGEQLRSEVVDGGVDTAVVIPLSYRAGEVDSVDCVIEVRRSRGNGHHFGRDGLAQRR